MKLPDYIKGDRRGVDAHRLEREALNDPFLSEALEGLDAAEGDPAESIRRLRRRVAQRSRSRRTVRRLWALGAAAALLLLFLVVGDRLLFQDPDVPAPPAIVAEMIREPEEELLPEPLPEKQEAETARQQIQLETTSDIINIVPDEERELTFADFSQDIDFIFEPQAVAKEELVAEEEFLRAKKNVTGKVVSSDGDPLPGATVRVPGTQIATTADREGRFTLPDAAGQTRIEASYLGYEPAEAALPADSSPVLIAMNESENQIDEVVVVGYGVERKSHMTGSVSRVEASPAPRRPQIAPDGIPARGADAYRKYLEENLIPQHDAAGNRITGKVVLEFRVNRQGRPAGIRVVESLSPEADGEARRLLETGPDWSRTDGRIRTQIDF